MFGHRISGSCLLRDGVLYGSSHDDEVVAVGSCLEGFVRKDGLFFCSFRHVVALFLNAFLLEIE